LNSAPQTSPNVQADGRTRRVRTRRCALTREVRPESELIRFVAGPDGMIVPDLKARLPGRGVWVRLERDKVAEAARRNVFARSLKRPVTASPSLAEEVAALLRKAALGRLGLARKAGQAVAGFAKVEAAVGAKRLAALITAREAAEDAVRKIEAAVRRRFGDDVPFVWLRMLSEAELGLAMGRAHVIHAAVLEGPAGRSFVEAATRFLRYQEGASEGGTAVRDARANG
jgi:uncharacterized protein